MSLPRRHAYAQSIDRDLRSFVTRDGRACRVRRLPRTGRATLLFECDGHFTTYDSSFGFDNVRAVPIGERRHFFELSG